LRDLGLILVLGLVMVVPRLGKPGLLDPWEMDRADVARLVSGPARVIVADVDGNPVFAALEAGLPASYSLRPVSEDQAGTGARLGAAATLLTEGVWHAAVLNLDLQLTGLGEEAVDAMWQRLDKMLSSAAGTAFVLVSARHDPVALRAALEGARERAVRAAADKPATETTTRPEVLVAALGPLVATVAPEGAVEAVQRLTPSPWARVVHKSSGANAAGPVLDAWLIAAFYKAFGASETTSRLPGALISVLALLLAALGTGLLYGRRAAWLTAVVLMSMSLWLGPARAVLLESGAVLGLTLVAFSLAFGVARGGRSWLVSYAIGLVTLYLAQGVSGLLIAMGIVGAYVVVVRDLRREILTAAVLSVALFASALGAVFGARQSGWWRHFRFTQTPYGGGVQALHSNFDWFVRSVGFGSYPWCGVFLVGVGRLFGLGGVDVARDDENEDPQGRAKLVLGLSFAVPVIVLGALMRDFGHSFAPVAPLVAVASALVLDEALEGRYSGRFLAFVTLVSVFLLHREIGKSVEPLLALVAHDPPMDLEKGDYIFPAELAFPRTALMLALLGIAFFSAAVGGLFRRGAEVVEAARQQRRTAWSIGVVGVLWGIDTIASLGLRLDISLKSDRTIANIPQDRLFTQYLAGRPDVIAVVAMFALLALVAALRSGAPGGLLLGWRDSVLKLVESLHLAGLVRLVARLASHDLIGLALVAAGAISVAVAGAGVLIAVGQVLPQSPAVTSAVASEGFIGALALAVLAFAISRGFGVSLLRARPMLAPLAGLEGRAGVIGAIFVALLGVAAIGVVATRLSGTWSYAFTGAVYACAVAVALFLFARVRTLGATGWLAAAGAFVAWVAIFHPMALKYASWAADKAEAEPAGAYLLRVLVASPDSGVLIAVFVVLLVNGMASARPAIAAPLDKVLALLRRCDQPRAAVSALVVAGLLSGTVFAHAVLPDLSLHFSQKHLLDLIERLGGGNARIFKHGTFQKKAGSPDTNFYTAGMPLISDRNALVEALRSHDVVTRVTDDGAPGKSGVVTIRGWDPANDADRDGKRDREGLASMATAVSGVTVTDAAQSWRPGQWKGALFIDGFGKTFRVADNSESMLTLDGLAPLTVASDPSRSQYMLDWPELANHRATAPGPTRLFVVLPKRGFSEINYSFRKAADGRHIFLVDDRSSRLVLAASSLGDGEADHNWIRRATYTQPQFDALTDVKRGFANFGDEIAFVGWKADEESVVRSKRYHMTLYWKALKAPTRSLKVFMHPHPLHRDHWPLNFIHDEEEKTCEGCYATNHWMEGDIIADAFDQEVALGTPSGPNEVIVGWYNPNDDKRLDVKEVRGDGMVKHRDDRVTVGTLLVR